MGTRARLCALAVVAANAGCSEDGPSLAIGDVHFDVPLDEPGAPTGRLVGWNVGRGTLYATDGDTVHPEWRTPERVAAFARLAAIASGTHEPPHVRFSGLQIDGALGSDGYHFWDFADPAREIADDDNMAPYQSMTIVDEIGGTPLVTLNFGSGTADEARRYVDHLVGDGDSAEVDARAHWGRDAPWLVTTYEIGNEVYGFWNTGYGSDGAYSYANPEAMNGGDPDWYGRPSADPADYAARALAYLDAVAQVQPTARVWVPLSQASMDAWGGLEAALAGLEPLLLHERVEAVVVHHYTVDDVAALGAMDKAAPELALAGTSLLRPGYEDLRERLAALPRATPLQLAITEYHVAGAFTLGGFDALADTPLVGLGVADALLSFADLGVEHAAQHMAIAFGDDATAEALFEPWYNPLRVVEGEVVPRPSYVATELVARHLRRDTVRLDDDKMLFDTYEEGELAFEYPLVAGVAFVDDTSATIVGLHRDLESSHRITFDLDSRWTAVSAEIYAPADPLAPIASAPVETEALELDQSNRRLRLELPPHSLFAVELERGSADQ